MSYLLFKINIVFIYLLLEIKASLFEYESNLENYNKNSDINILNDNESYYTENIHYNRKTSYNKIIFKQIKPNVLNLGYNYLSKIGTYYYIIDLSIYKRSAISFINDKDIMTIKACYSNKYVFTDEDFQDDKNLYTSENIISFEYNENYFEDKNIFFRYINQFSNTDEFLQRKKIKYVEFLLIKVEVKNLSINKSINSLDKELPYLYLFNNIKLINKLDSCINTYEFKSNLNFEIKNFNSIYNQNSFFYIYYSYDKDTSKLPYEEDTIVICKDIICSDSHFRKDKNVLLSFKPIRYNRISINLKEFAKYSSMYILVFRTNYKDSTQNVSRKIQIFQSRNFYSETIYNYSAMTFAMDQDQMLFFRIKLKNDDYQIITAESNKGDILNFNLVFAKSINNCKSINNYNLFFNKSVNLNYFKIQKSTEPVTSEYLIRIKTNQAVYATLFFNKLTNNIYNNLAKSNSIYLSKSKYYINNFFNLQSDKFINKFHNQVFDHSLNVINDNNYLNSYNNKIVKNYNQGIQDNGNEEMFILFINKYEFKTTMNCANLQTLLILSNPNKTKIYYKQLGKEEEGKLINNSLDVVLEEQDFKDFTNELYTEDKTSYTDEIIVHVYNEKKNKLYIYKNNNLLTEDYTYLPYTNFLYENDYKLLLKYSHESNEVVLFFDLIYDAYDLTSIELHSLNGHLQEASYRVVPKTNIIHLDKYHNNNFDNVNQIELYSNYDFHDLSGYKFEYGKFIYYSLPAPDDKDSTNYLIELRIKLNKVMKEKLLEIKYYFGSKSDYDYDISGYSTFSILFFAITILSIGVFLILSLYYCLKQKSIS